MVSLIATAAVFSLITGRAPAQTTADLGNDASEPNDVLTYGIGYNAQRYSRLKQITKSNVGRLVPVWALGLENDYGELGQPLVMQGVMWCSSRRGPAINAARKRCPAQQSSRCPRVPNELRRSRRDASA